MDREPAKLSSFQLGNVEVETSGPQSARIASWAKHQFAHDAFRQVLEVMTRHAIDVLPVKGIVLAHTLYNSVEERPMLDVDLRVRPRDLRRVADAARSQGWDVRRTSRQLGALEFTVSRTLIEVESSIGSPGVCAFGIDEMLARSAWRTGPLGIAHREPELHDHALHLCVNVFKDKLVFAPPWAREDLLRIAEAPGFSPALMASRADEAKLRTLVWIVAEWLADDSRGAAWRTVGNTVGLPRLAYAKLFGVFARRFPEGFTMRLLARAASDAFPNRVRAVGLGVAGTFLRLTNVLLAGGPSGPE